MDSSTYIQLLFDDLALKGFSMDELFIPFLASEIATRVGPDSLS